MYVKMKIEVALQVTAHNLHKVEIAKSSIRHAVSEALTSEANLWHASLEEVITENLREALENKYEAVLAREAVLSAERGRDKPTEDEIDSLEDHLRFWWAVNVREEAEDASPKSDPPSEDQVPLD
jgi:hypothetical protein